MQRLEEIAELDFLPTNKEETEFNVLIDRDRLDFVTEPLESDPNLEDIKIRGRGEIISYEKITLINFTFALTVNKKIRILLLNSIPLTYFGLSCLAYSCNANCLQSLTLVDCGITTAAEIREVERLLKFNYCLHSLNLSGNHLDEEAIHQLATLLPKLIYLKTLMLNNIRLNKETLEVLVEAWLAAQLPIKNFEVQRNYLRVALEPILKLIEHSASLKKLNMSYCGLGNKSIAKLAPVLADPKKCRLEKLIFLDTLPINKKMRKLLVTVLTNNYYLCVLHPPLGKGLSTKHLAAMEKNENKKTLRLFNIFLEIAKFHFAATAENDKNKFADLTYEIVMMILAEYARHIPYLTNERLLGWIDIIFTNLNTRRNLIKAGGYDPHEKFPPIKQWWSGKRPANVTFFHPISICQQGPSPPASARHSCLK